MKTVPLKADLRQEIGKQAAKKIRAKKRIPAVVYGSGIKATPIEVSADDFFRTIHTRAGENVVIQLTVSGSKNFEKTVVIKEIQLNPVTDGVEHVDFNAISLTEKIKVNVPFHVKGEAPGLKEGGVLDVVHYEIEVECLPTDIPERLEADISALKIGDSIHIGEIKFPVGIVPQLSPDEVVVTVHAPKAEEVPAAEEAPAEPELIAKEKEEEGAEEAAPAPAAAPPTGEAKKPTGEVKK
jgi:large subunit ribosomal protein L25